MIIEILMGKDQGISTAGFRLTARIIISHRRAFPLIIMMLSCHINRLFSRICDQFRMVKLPDDISIPVYLYQICLILIGIFSAPCSGCSHHISTRQDLIRESAKSSPELHFISVHID